MLNKKQTIGVTGKSPIGATAFIQFHFKTSLSPFVETMTSESLMRILFQDDTIEIFSFVYDKEIPECSNIEQLF